MSSPGQQALWKGRGHGLQIHPVFSSSLRIAHASGLLEVIRLQWVACSFIEKGVASLQHTIQQVTDQQRCAQTSSCKDCWHYA